MPPPALFPRGFISQNPVRKPKKLWTEKNEGEKLYYCIANSENDEARYIAKSIRELYLKGKYSYSDFAVLYRMNLQARALEEALRVYGMPYRIIGGVSFYQRREVKDIISYLKVINNPKDSVSLKRIINCPPRGIGDTTTARIENEAKKKNKSFFDAMKSLSSSSDSAALKEKITDFIEIIDELTAKRGMALPQ
ncbi:MAG: ATP-dependent DNA helicase PcrA, partial [Nitrospirae bacterium]|nr:ATP-dependent DNA helicase PcrA [Nitrospirota bacterium]